VWTLCLAVTGETTGYCVLPVRSIFKTKERSEVVVSQKNAGINIEMIHVTTRVLVELKVKYSLTDLQLFLCLLQLPMSMPHFPVNSSHFTTQDFRRGPKRQKR
jgi:hypothetical protein